MYKKAFELSYKNKKVEIEIQDFVGDVRNINGTEDLFSLSYISDSKDKGQSILVTEADINFYADDYFNIDELKTVGETDIKVKYYEDGALLWSGFVIPDFFSTSVDIAPAVSMVATDRVGTLKEISNNAESNIPIQILASCLKQTGQDLPINLIADNNHFGTPIQLERIEEIASYDVIRSFMVLFNCKITLYKNAWWIINKKLLESGFVNYKSYNSDGVGGSVTPFAQPILDIDLVDRDGQREIKPTASEISLFLEFGGSKKYPKNWNFEEWIINPQATSTALFNDWELKGVFYPYPFTDLLPIANNNQITGYEVSGNSLVATKDTSINYDSYNLQLRTSTQQGSGTDQSKMSYRHLESSYSKVVFLDGKTEIKVSINFTNPSGEFINVTPVIRTKNSNGTLKRYFAIDNDKSVKKAGEASINLFGVEPIRVEATQSETKIAVQTKWENIFITDDSTLELAEGDTADVMLIIWGVRFYPLGAPNIKSYIDTFIHSANISFNDYEVTGKGLIFKIKQGGEKFSKSREPETILFSDKINQGVNGYFYNYKYDDTSIVDLPSEFALSSVRERADMFSKARDFYSLDGNFIVNPLAKYVCGSKSFVLVGGENRREDASIIVEEIVSNTLNRTDFIYTYFDDGKDKVKSIGTASGGSSSSGGGGSSPSAPQLIKVDEEGNYYSEQPFYSLGGLSAFGFSEVGDGNGDGVIINVIDSLTSTSKTDPLSANMGRYLKTLIDNIEVGEGGQVIVDWEAITGKPTTFTPSAHSHIIGDVTGLQSALDGKASLSQLDDKEDAFTKNSAFNKNFGTGLNDVARGNHTHAFASLTSKPTTLSGYGITDGANKVHTHSISDITNLQTALNNKLETSVFNSHKDNSNTEKHVTQANLDVLDLLSIVDGNLRIDANTYSTGNLSAFGLEEEGGGSGGGSMNMMQTWSTSVETENYYLPAKLAVPFYNDTRNRLSTLEAGTAPASHTHPISDITNLQTTLNNKLETSIFNAHNTDNIRHITGVERAKWDKVVTDFEELEIGGRNYVLNSDEVIDNSNSESTYLIKDYTITGEGIPVGDDVTLSVNLTCFEGFESKILPLGIRDYALFSNMTEGFVGTKTFTIQSIKYNTPHRLQFYNHSIGSTQSDWDKNAFVINWVKLEKGNKATDWSPAPEDQVSDWATTDVNSFSFIKNKPTTLGGYGITDAYTKTNVDTLLSGKENTFTKNSAFNKNFGTTAGTVAQGNHTHTPTQVGLGNVPNIDFRTMGYNFDYTFIRASFGTLSIEFDEEYNSENELHIISISQFTTIDVRISTRAYAGSHEIRQVSSSSGVVGVAKKYKKGDKTVIVLDVNTGWSTIGVKLRTRYNNYNKSVLLEANPSLAGLVEVATAVNNSIYHSGNHRSNTENDTRYKEPFDAFKTTFDTMFRKTATNEIEAKLSLYTLGGLSAYGFSDEGSSGGGGGIINILSQWANYDTSKSGWALSAGLGENLRTRVVALENAEIDLSAYATLNYVNDKVKTNAPLNAKFTDTIVDISGKVDKKTGFSLISDTEIVRLSSVTNQDLSSYAKTSDVNTLLLNKVDKITGKSLISDTEITRLSSVTNQDLTPYALKTYVDTEVGKKWTYSEATIKTVKVNNAIGADNVGGFTVGIDVPANAKFTDTIVDISGKVDKVTGKGLSTNDFTTAEKNKLATLENQTKVSLGLDNVTNESKLTMFTNPTFTGTTKVTILELNSNWKFVKVGDNIELQFDGVTKQIMTNNGDIVATAGVTAYQ